jgi:hypothetical protein
MSATRCTIRRTVCWIFLLSWLTLSCGDDPPPGRDFDGAHEKYSQAYAYAKNTAEEAEPPWRREGGGYVVELHSEIYPEGEWDATVRLNQQAFAAGDTIEVGADLRIRSAYLRQHVNELDSLAACLSAVRLFDADGRQRARNNVAMSTRLTPTGLPIEAYNPGQASHKLGKTWTGPVDELALVPVSAVTRDGDVLPAHFRLTAKVGDEFPAGYYRFEINFYAVKNGEATPVALYPGLQQILNEQAPIEFYSVARYAFLTHRLPLVRVKNPKPPRLVWTLFTGLYSNGTLGVVAEEDRNRFAFTSNLTFQARLVAPRFDAAGQPAVYTLEPDLPMVVPHRLLPLSGKFQEVVRPELPLDYASGSLSVTVIEPDGRRTRLGQAPFTGESPYGATTGDPRFRFAFRQWGPHRIQLSGRLRDVWGHEYDGGGTYEVMVANRLTLDTTVKPGSPYLQGDTFGIAVTVNPPCRADARVDLQHYPQSDPARRQRLVVQKTTNRYGYLLSGPMLTFAEPGEYLAEVTASCRDDRGALWFGTQRSAGVVALKDTDFVAHGLPWQPPEPGAAPQTRYNLHAEAMTFRDGVPFAERNCLTQHTLGFPYYSGDVLYIGLNDAFGANAVLPALTAEDRRGDLAARMQRVSLNGSIFTSTLGRPGQPGPSTQRFAERLYAVVNFHHIVRTAVDAAALPLLSDTSNGYPPHEYPEFVTRQAYYYASAFRPGFVVRQIVSENPQTSTYWTTSDAGIQQIGASADAEEDVYRLNGGVVWREPSHGAPRYGVYGATAVTVPKGAYANRVVAPLSEPLYAPMARPYPLFLATGPGMVLETGDTFLLGGTVFPPIEAQAYGAVVFPNGETREFRGRCNAVGKCVYPDAVIAVTEPGVYRVRQHVEADEQRGGVVGAADGEFFHLAAPRDGPDLITIDLPDVAPFHPLEPLAVNGSLPLELRDASVHYILLVTGAVLDQGRLPVREGAFSYRLYLPDLQRQFKAIDLFDAGGNVRGVDTMELTFFAQATDAAGKPVRAVKKVVLRGNVAHTRGRLN